MKNALRTIAEANEERNTTFALDLKKGSGICRLSAYLHLFHYQVRKRIGVSQFLLSSR